MSNFLVIGLGRFGRHACHKLNELGNQVLAIDSDESTVQLVLPYVTDALIGDATDEKFLETLGIRDFDACLVCIGDDFQSSVEITYLLKDVFNAKKIITRASRDRHEKLLRKAGADQVVYAERIMGEQTAVKCSAKQILNYFKLDATTGIFEVSAPSAWVGKTLIELNVRAKYGINIIGLKEDGVLNVSIAGNTVIKEDNNILIAGEASKIEKFFVKL